MGIGRRFLISCCRCSTLKTIVTKQGFKCLTCGFFVSLDEMIEETKRVEEEMKNARVW